MRRFAIRDGSDAFAILLAVILAPDPVDDSRYFTSLAAAFVRGRLPELADEGDDSTVLARGMAAGLRLHKFKRNTELPRVHRVLGALRGLAPESLLDVGSGRGTFLWPLLEAFPALPVTALDRDPGRAADLQATARGGIARLTAACMDAESLAFADAAFDTVTLLASLWGNTLSGTTALLAEIPFAGEFSSSMTGLNDGTPFIAVMNRTTASLSPNTGLLSLFINGAPSASAMAAAYTNTGGDGLCCQAVGRGRLTSSSSERVRCFAGSTAGTSSRH